MRLPSFTNRSVIAGLLVAGSFAAPAAVAWPGTSPAKVADEAGVLGGNVSGLAAGEDGSLWAVRDDPGSLLLLDRVAPNGTWRPREGWGSGRSLRYPDGHGGPDAEAVTRAASDAAAVYVGAERDNSVAQTSRNSVLRFEPGRTGPLTATREWNLTSLLPATNANAGIEGLAWVPDSVLVAAKFRDSNGRAYVPATLPAHGDGVFVVALEQNGGLYLTALHDDGGATLLATVSTGQRSVMEAVWVADRGELWAACDNACDGEITALTFDGGELVVASSIKSPRGSEDLNNEGLAVFGCAADAALVVWSDDSVDDGHALRESTIACRQVAPGPVTTSAQPGTSGSPSTTSRVGASSAPPSIVVENQGESSASGVLVAVAVVLGVAAAGGAVGALVVVARRRQP
ncbi:MAG: esterase-like activity of phytase family protein [Acidimicrobiia bacterium]